MKTIRIGIVITESLRKKILTIAEQEDKTFNAVIQELLVEGVKKKGT